MALKTDAEYKTLERYYKRMLVLVRLVNEYRGEPKSMATVIKLVKSERARTEQSKGAVSAEDMRETVWLYDELLKNAKLLKKTSDAIVYSKACQDIDKLQNKICDECAAIATFVERRDGDTVADKIKSGVKKLGGIMDGAFDRLKKVVTEENSE